MLSHINSDILQKQETLFFKDLLTFYFYTPEGYYVMAQAVFLSSISKFLWTQLLQFSFDDLETYWDCHPWYVVVHKGWIFLFVLS